MPGFGPIVETMPPVLCRFMLTTNIEVHNDSLCKERAAPPIGGPALHDSGVKTVQWRKREGHDSYQEVEVYIYIWAITKNGYTRSGFFAERVLSKTK